VFSRFIRRRIFRPTGDEGGGETIFTTDGTDGGFGSKHRRSY